MTLVVPGTASDFPLTGEQQAVVDSDAPALVATASAGTGKTEILVRRVECYINDPDSGNANVLVITYTTRAANEFKSRLHGRVGSSMQRIFADTVHGFAHSVLISHGSHVGLPPDFQVINNTEDRAELLAAYDIWLAPDNPADLFRQLDLARAKCQSHPDLKCWRDALESRGAVDFSEMITKATDVLLIPAIARMMRVIYGMVIVDEAQNLTEQQYRLITALVGTDTETGQPLVSTTLLGDPNQSVTGFAGGDSRLMTRFVEDYGATRVSTHAELQVVSAFGLAGASGLAGTRRRETSRRCPRRTRRRRRDRLRGAPERSGREFLRRRLGRRSPQRRPTRRSRLPW